MEMTPLKISILIHYYCSPTDIDNVDSPAVQEAINEFIKLSLMFHSATHLTNQKYEANREAVKVYIEALEAVPLPVRGWSIPLAPSQKE